MTDWTREMDDAVRVMWDQGKSQSLIAREISAKFRVKISKNSIAGKANRLKLTKRPNIIGVHTVGDDKIAEIRRLLSSRNSNKHISRTLDVYIAKVRKIRAEMGITPNLRHARPQDMSDNVFQLPPPARHHRTLRGPQPPTAPLCVFNPPATNACRWLDGDDRQTWRQCTEVAVSGTSWCAHHICIVFRNAA